MSSAGSQHALAVSIAAATVSGGISDGVPPPKKTVSSRRPGVNPAK